MQFLDSSTILIKNTKPPYYGPMLWNGLSLALGLLLSVLSNSLSAHLKTVLFSHSEIGSTPD